MLGSEYVRLHMCSNFGDQKLRKIGQSSHPCRRRVFTSDIHFNSYLPHFESFQIISSHFVTFNSTANESVTRNDSGACLTARAVKRNVTRNVSGVHLTAKTGPGSRKQRNAVLCRMRRTATGIKWHCTTCTSHVQLWLLNALTFRLTLRLTVDI